MNWVDHYFLGRSSYMSGITFISSPDMNHKQQQKKGAKVWYKKIRLRTAVWGEMRDKGKPEKWQKFWEGIN